MSHLGPNKGIIAFLFSFLVGLYALHRLTLVREVGEVSERTVLLELVSAFGREMREFSTVATMRNFIEVAGVAVRKIAPGVEETQPHDPLAKDTER